MNTLLFLRGKLVAFAKQLTPRLYHYGNILGKEFRLFWGMQFMDVVIWVICSCLIIDLLNSLLDKLRHQNDDHENN